MVNFSGGSRRGLHGSLRMSDGWLRIEYGVNTFLAEHGGMPNRHEPPPESPMCKRGLANLPEKKTFHLCTNFGQWYEPEKKKSVTSDPYS